MTTETPEREPERPTGQQVALHDPFKGQDLDQVPEAMFQAVGLTREEAKRHRDAPPAIEHGAGAKAAEPAGEEPASSQP